MLNWCTSISKAGPNTRRKLGTSIPVYIANDFLSPGLCSILADNYYAQPKNTLVQFI